MPQQYVVPQYTDKEDTIFGPITIRQFLICILGAGLIFVLNQLLTGIALYATAGPIAVLIAVIAFVNVNGYPMHIFIFNFIMYIKRPSKRVWALRGNQTSLSTKSPPKRVKASLEEKESLSRLSELSLIVDTGGTFRGTSNEIRLNTDEV